MPSASHLGCLAATAALIVAFGAQPAAANENGRWCLYDYNTHEHSCSHPTLFDCRYFATPSHASCTVNPKYNPRQRRGPESP